MPLSSLLEVLKKAQKNHPTFGQRMDEAEALGRWATAVGPLISKHTRPLRVVDKCLWVEVDHSIWRSELHFKKHQILNILNGKTQPAHSKLPPPKEILIDLFLVEPESRKPLKPYPTR